MVEQEKFIRKHFVPAPEYVDKVLENFEYDGKPLTVALADRLFRVSGTRVKADDFQSDALDRHLSLNVRVVGERGKVLAAGRDLGALVDSLSDQISEEVQNREEHQLEISGATDWTFGEVPEIVEVRKGGVSVTLYPAIVDEGETVGVRLVETAFQAVRLTEQGLLRLMLQRLSDQVRFLEKNIPDFDRFALFFATRGSGSDLKKGIVRAAFRATFLAGESIRTREAFEAILVRREGLFESMEQIARIAATSLEHALAIESAAKALPHGDIADDILGQLDAMFPANFPEGTAFEWLRHYPRYLKAIKYRLERLNPEKDRAAMHKVHGWQERYRALHDEDQARLATFRWMLEEFRVSFFAQQLGTVMTVSVKRLDRQWEKTKV